jgi:hypothetical protein
LIRPVFTPAGGVVLIIAIALLIRSLTARNSYEIALSSAALLLLLILGVIGKWKSRKMEQMEPGWKPPFPMTANAVDNNMRITGLDAPVPLFFRLHFIVKGRFFPAGRILGKFRGCPVLVETSVPRGETAAQLPFDFPVSGVFSGDGHCALRDIFGFYSFRCGKPQRRSVNVRSAPCFGTKLPINPQSGSEDQRNKTSSSEERYYMREYTPGDRFRDINWKSSEKIDVLITRISPDNQEKVSRIDVYFRNFGLNADNRENRASLEASWLLDRAKARLAYFLRNVREQNSSFIFNVRFASGSRDIEDEEDLDAFLEELAGLSFSPSRNETAEIVSAAGGDIYVFSTACDIGLPDYLVANSQKQVSLFLIQPAQREKDIETLNIKSFIRKGSVPSVGWLAGKKTKPLSVRSARMELTYAEVKL